jgi:hypothetical protein
VTRGTWLHRAGLALLSALLVGSIWYVPYLPTTDGPEWIFAAHAEIHYGDPDAPYPAVLVPTLQFASRGVSVLLGPFDAWLGWQHGVQVTLSVVALGAAWGFVALVHSVSSERRALAYLGFPLSLSWAFYMGLWPFVVSLALGSFIIALAVRLRQPSSVGRAVLGLLLLLQAVAHVFGAVLTGAVVATVAAARAPRGGRLAELGRVLLTGIPAAGIFVACAWLSRDITHAPLVDHFTHLSFADTLATLPRIVLPGPLVRALLAAVVILGAGTLAAVRAFRAGTSAEDRALGLAAVVLLLTGAAGPFQIPGWQFFSQRFVPVGAALALVVLPVERLAPSLRRALSLGLLALAVLSLVASYPLHRRLAALCPSAVQGLSTSTRTHGEILALSLRPTERPTYSFVTAEVPFDNPLLHMGTLYAVALGGIPAFSFTGVPAIHAFTRRPTTRPRPAPEELVAAFGSYAFSHDLAAREATLRELSTYALYYDEVAIFGAIPSDLELWKKQGFETDFQAGATLLAHFVPCTIDFTVPAAADDPPPAFDIGVDHVKVFSDLHPPPTTLDDGLTHFSLAPSPCGSVSIRVRWANGARCRNADDEGMMRAVVTRASSRVACDAP